MAEQAAEPLISEAPDDNATTAVESEVEVAVGAAVEAGIKTGEKLSAFISPVTTAFRHSAMLAHLKAISPYVIEFIGALYLVATVVFVVSQPFPDVGAPIVVGFTLLVIVFFGGHISGGHYNPAVSVAVWCRGSIPLLKALGYIVAQIGGGLAGSAISNATVNAGAGAPFCGPGEGFNHGHVFLVEFMYTFLLTFTVLQVATTTTNPGKDANHFFGLAIGLSVLVGAAAVGHISGGAFNPAVAVGMNVVAMKGLKSLWCYILAELAAGFAAGLIFYITNASEFTDSA